MIRRSRDSTTNRNYRHQSGFILSMEAVLLFTILGIGLFLGMSTLRNSLIKYYVNQVNTRFFVADSTTDPILIGDVVGFDEHETPLVVFTDYDLDSNLLPGDFNYRTLIGIRDDRFTTRQPLLYSDASCGVPACIPGRSSEVANGLIVTAAKTTGTISYMSAMQGANAPVYAVGRILTGATPDKDHLYRSTGIACAVDLRSMWVSQTLGTNAESCIPVNVNGISDLASFESAVAVPMPTDASNNVLSKLIAPFFLNMIDKPQTFTETTPIAESN
jgi:hypothetical protein